MFARVTEIGEALKLLSQGKWTLIAGGTDFYPALNDALPEGNLLDIGSICPPQKISEQDDYWRFHALTSWRDVQDADLPQGFHSLQQVAREVGSIQIQNRATIAGNLCTASPAGDSIPVLLALDAEIEVMSLAQTRTLKLADFITGYRTHALKDDELVSAILIPKAKSQGQSFFYKLGGRKYLVISIAMVAVYFKLQDDVIIEIAIAVGACSAVAQRITALEQILCGKSVSQDLTVYIAHAQFIELTPLDDVRSSEEYRRQIVPELVKYALKEMVANHHAGKARKELGNGN